MKNSKEFNLIGGLSVLILAICYISLIGSATAADTYINTTNIITGMEPETVGGKDVITPHTHYWDSWFSFYNEDCITYQVYMYDYTGIHLNNYTDSFVGVVRPGEVMLMNENASYYIYAEYPDIKGLESVDDVREGVNRYWVIAVVALIGIITLFTGIKIIRRRN